MPDDSGFRGFPLEVWERIIGLISDDRYLPRVWLNFRRVSRTVKAATERVFVTMHLRRTHIGFDPFPSIRDRNENKYKLDVLLDFNRLSDDGSRAIYAPKDPRDWEWMKEIHMSETNTFSLYDHFIQEWRSLLEPYLAENPNENDFSRPSHVLTFRREANDTELPGLMVNFERSEALVLWEPMLSMFFGELEYKKWADKVNFQHSEGDELMDEVAEEVMSGRANMEDFFGGDLFKRIANKCQNIEQGVTTSIRRMRFQRIARKIGRAELDSYDLNEDPRHTEFLKDTKRALGLATFDTDDEESERNQGDFYDGMGMKFEGKGETNEPGEDSDYDFDWETEDEVEDEYEEDPA